jgi:LuxR family maltose regulon positive regulatory protein
MQQYPLLQTKLYIPPIRRELVSRPRLVERLDAGMDRKLTLVSAPAGFGKTTLISEWLAGCQQRAAWLSLDESDNDPTRFLAYSITALQAFGDNVGGEALSALQSPQPPPTEAVLTSLINEVAAFPNRMVFVLDDYHVIEAQPIHGALTFLLDHLPPQLHLIIITRSDPSLPLAGLRGRGELVELREPDLRFTRDEAKALLNQVTGLDLDQAAVTTLERRTEGWAVGLQLAGLAMQGRSDVAGFIEAFAGDHTYIIDYLTDEVLDQQTEEVRTFLLQTSILHRLSGPLCEAVLSGPERSIPSTSSQEMLAYLARNNLFVIPLDDRRHWYRYHQLFADLLRYRLKQTQPTQVSELHRRASAWYASHDLVEDAVQHALAAGDYDRAADLIESVGAVMMGQGRFATLRAWVERLPEPVIRERPQICVGQAWYFNLTGQIEAIEPCLQAAERALQTGAFDQRTAAELRGAIALLRAFIAGYQNNVPRAVELLLEALTHLPEDQLYYRSVAYLRLGTIYKHQSAWEAAVEAARQAQALGEAAGNLYSALFAISLQAEVLTLQGQLRGGAKLCQNTIDQYLARQGERAIPSLGFAYITLGQILYEWNDLQAAAHILGQGIKLGEKVMAVWPVMRDGFTSLAWLKQMQGEPDEAESFLERAMDIAERSPEPFGRIDVAARQARLWLAQNNMAAAMHWAQAHRGTGPEARSELAELTLARVLLAQGKADEALGTLAPLGQALEAAGRKDGLIEVLVLKALAHQTQSDTASALEALGHALSLAEPEGYCRTFVDEGPSMATLLAQCLLQPGHTAEQVRPFSPDYVNQLLAAFPPHEPEPGAAPSSPASPALAYLPDPLNDREIEVLHLLAAGLKTPEIADRLILAPSTIKWHLKNIYSKLGVHRRSEAIAQARTLGLLK